MASKLPSEGAIQLIEDVHAAITEAADTRVLVLFNVAFTL